MEEEWKDVVGYEQYFRVSNLGRVWSKRTNKIIKQESLSKVGYKIFSTRFDGRNGRAIAFRVHILVAEAFLEEPKSYQKEWAKTTKYGKVYVNHLDGDKENNIVSNLEWATARENSAHFYSSPKSDVVKLHLSKVNSVFTEDEIRKIRYEYAKGGTSERKLAAKYGVTRRNITTALKKSKWVD